MFTYKHKFCITFILFVGFSATVFAQSDSTGFKRLPVDTLRPKLNMDATYNRPFLAAGKLPLAIGGYAEANTQFSQTDGVNEGLSFQFRRLTLFFSSTIAKRIKFLSELEFEDGTKEINLEFAAIDLEFHPLLTLRGGIILNPIGGFNQNHDSPRWDFIDRPLSATTILPSTLSNAGFGFYGKHFSRNWVLGYEAYLTNGFNQNIISNTDNRTSLAAGKSNPERFEESPSGIPMFNGKIAIRQRKIAELGISYANNVYNTWKEDGLIIDQKRQLNIAAVDLNTSLAHNRINITAEYAKVWVQVPATYSQQFGKEQQGFFVDVVGTIYKKPILDWENAKINLGIRVEYTDYNQGRFVETNGNIGDALWAVVPALAFRPTGTTVLRANYRYQQQQDILGNPPANTGTIQFGLASYF